MIFLPRSDFEDLLGISDERDKLLLERADLLLRLAELTNQSVQHLASLAKKDIEIEELRRENLKMRISSLESQVSQQAAEILHLQAHVSRQATKTEYETFITALQDSNSIYQLEEDSPGMFDLRQLQNKFSHFITNHDSPELVNYKISILITKLQKDMSVAYRSRFQRRFGETFINDVVQLLSSNLGNRNVSISSIEKKRANEWWDDELL